MTVSRSRINATLLLSSSPLTFRLLVTDEAKPLEFIYWFPIGKFIAKKNPRGRTEPEMRHLPPRVVTSHFMRAEIVVKRNACHIATRYVATGFAHYLGRLLSKSSYSWSLVLSE